MSKPLYVELSEKLQSRALQNNGIIGTVTELQDDYGIARATVYNAISYMRKQGFNIPRNSSPYRIMPNEIAQLPPSDKMEKQPMPELPPHREFGNNIVIGKDAFNTWLNSWMVIYPEYDVLVDLFNGD